jgi:hypothetical protein
MLQKGDYIGRRGSEFGRFFAPVGSTASELALPPGAENLPENVFQVIKPFPVYGGSVAPWFGQPGGGIQYYSLQPQYWLVDNGFIKLVP